MRKIILAAAVSVLAPSLACAETATVPSGKKTQIAIHSRFDNACRPARVIVTVLKAPAHGALTTAPADYVVPEKARNGVKQPPQCVGKRVKGVAVFYEPKPGFVGADSLRYRRANADRSDDRFNQDVDYAITVTR